MTTPPTIESARQDLSKLDLEPAKLDFLSVKTQIVFATILSAILVFATYWPTLNIGFLHDDWLHVDYIARAVLKGDWHDCLANLYSNWGGSDLMKSYRPLVSISLLTDFLVFKTNAVGFHITNILLTCGCCLFVALIACELSGNYGNRMRAATAIWAALLFAAYPLHVESVAWIIGRVDLLCTLFYLASLYYFLRLKLIEEPPYTWLSVGCFILALLSKEMAVTLPAVATVFAFLIPDNQKKDGPQKLWQLVIRIPGRLELRTLGLLWLTLIVFAVLRTMLLGSAIGGYGSDGLQSMLSSFANKGALFKLVVPVNEEILPLSKNLISLCFTTYIAAAVFAGLRCLATPSLIRYFVAFFLFAAIALLPTFQIWNIASNLCGSRLFFLSSAALALALAFAFVPSEDSIDKTSTKFVTAAGVSFLAFTLIAFSALSYKNVTVFTGAGEMVRKLRTQLHELHRQSPEKRFVVLNLPADYHGAPVLTRPQYFKTMVNKPFSIGDEGASFETAEMDLPYGHANYPAERLKELNESSQQRIPIVWSEADFQLHPLVIDQGEKGFVCSFRAPDAIGKCLFTPDTVRKIDGRNWHVFYKHEPQAVTLKGAIRLYPGDQGQSITQSIKPTNPLLTPLVKIKMTVDADQPVERLLHLITFTWTQKAGVLSQKNSANLLRTGEQTYECPLADNKEWLFGGPKKGAGISLLCSPFYVNLQSIEGIPQEECTPELSQLDNQRRFHINAENVRDAAASVLLISKADTAFDTAIDLNVLRNYRNLKVSQQENVLVSPDDSIRGKVQTWIFLAQKRGNFDLPSSVLKDAKNHQVVALALDKNGCMIGLPSRVLKVN